MQGARSFSDSAASIDRLCRRFSLERIATGIVFACSVFQASYAPAQEFTDFTTFDSANGIASGSIGHVAVAFSGTFIASGHTGNDFAGFNHPFFAPPLPASDSGRFFTNATLSTYMITFDSSVTDPRLHLYSLGSTLDFGVIPLTKLSGQDFFFVSGSTVTGVADDFPPPGTPTDANGTVQLNGTFTSLNFTATTIHGGDEIFLQIGFVPGHPGDYNDDGLVDASDYVVWRKNVGAPAGALPNDIDGGTIGPAQYQTWRANFGEPNGAAAGEAGAFTQAEVPEPTTLALFVFAAAGGCFRRFRGA
jgi:hypothetical protein